MHAQKEYEETFSLHVNLILGTETTENNKTQRKITNHGEEGESDFKSHPILIFKC